MTTADAQRLQNTAVEPAASQAGLPGWLIGMSWMVLAGTLFVFGLGTFFWPSEAFPAAGEGSEFPIRFMAIRHVAFALPLLHGILTRNATILATMYRIFWVMSLLDVITLVAFDYYIPFVGPDALSRWVTGVLAFGLFFVPMTVATFHLTRSPLKR